MESDEKFGDPLLKKPEVPIISRDECDRRYFTSNFFFDHFKSCGSLINHFLDKSICTEDSGSVLTTVQNVV